MTSLTAARRYVSDGLAVVPIPRGEKRPVVPRWPELRLADADLARHFRNGCNVGVLNGEPSGGLVDVDLDADEVVTVAPRFLPETGRAFGRTSRPRSHWVYRIQGALATEQFRDVDGTMIAEIRSTGTQTLWPPSVHPSGERVTFDAEGEPAVIDAGELRVAVRRTAAVALLARHWPKAPGQRHTIANALAGLLLRGGVTEDEAAALVRRAARAAGDEQWKARGTDVRSTAQALGAGTPATGGPALAALLGDGVVAKLCDWLHLTSQRGSASHGTPVIVRMIDVEPEDVRWIDRGRIPLGKLTVLDGDPGTGKSTLMFDYAARVSTGATMPDGSSSDLDGPAGVVILSAEDGPGDTIRPRLDAAGADCSRIVTVPGISYGTSQRPLTVGDLDAIEEAIASCDAKLVIIDPLMAYMPSSTNAHRDQDVRVVLAGLAALAERMGCAIVVIRHLNKATLPLNPMYRGGGSIGIIGAARSGLLVAIDPEDESQRRRVLASIKCNLAARPAALAFRLKPVGDTTRVVWKGPIDRDPMSLLGSCDDGMETKLDRARDFLRDALKGGPVGASDVLSRASKEGLSERTIRRAKSELKVRSERVPDGPWEWSLSEGQRGS